uniref:Ig-like domain-containing protein n=1 Tax=Ditylenchus dipsaci TaxID=166011 RepID=A0A915E2A2_9BILA
MEMKSGQALPMHSLSRMGTQFSLEIPEADLDDTADYTVKVTDDDGATADSSCHLTDQTVKKKDKAVLEVETDKSAKVVKWYKNGDEIRPGTANAQPKQDGDTKFSLEIPEADLDDSADLLAGIGFVKPLQDQTVKKKDKAVLEVETDKPAKVVKWYRMEMKSGQALPMHSLSRMGTKIQFGNSRR